MNGRTWTLAELQLLRQRYPHEKTTVLAAEMRRPLTGVYRQAFMLRLKKTPEFLATSESGRLTKLTNSGVQFRFKKGLVPANKGMRRPGWAPGRMGATQFKKGHGGCPSRTMQIGDTRINGDDYLDRKVRNDGLPQKRWVGVHRLVWIEHHGPIPDGYVVTFKPGRRTVVESEITLDALQLSSRQDLMSRNTIHNLPPALKEVLVLKGAIRRHITMRERHEKQD